MASSSYWEEVTSPYTILVFFSHAARHCSHSESHLPARICCTRRPTLPHHRATFSSSKGPWAGLNYREYNFGSGFKQGLWTSSLLPFAGRSYRPSHEEYYMVAFQHRFPGISSLPHYLLIRVSRRAVRTVGVFHIRPKPPPSQDSFRNYRRPHKHSRGLDCCFAKTPVPTCSDDRSSHSATKAPETHLEVLRVLQRTQHCPFATLFKGRRDTNALLATEGPPTPS